MFTFVIPVVNLMTGQESFAKVPADTAKDAARCLYRWLRSIPNSSWIIDESRLWSVD